MPLRRSILLLLAGTGCWALTGLEKLAAQSQTSIPEETLLPEDTLYPNEAPHPDTDTNIRQRGEPEFPYRRVITGNANQGYYSESFSGRLEPKFGGARLTIPQDLLQFGFRFSGPLQSGVASTNAEIKLGRFSLDLLSLSGSILYSDNINRTDLNRKDGFISVLDLDMLGIFQITDRLRLAFRAALVYFPQEDKIGLAGFTRDRFGGRLFFGDSPYMLSQFTYDLEMDKWHLHLFDNLRSIQNLQANQFNFIGGERFDEEDRAGRYAFLTTISPSTNGVVVNETRDRSAFIEVINTVGGSIDRLLPTVTRFEAGAFHSDAFYYSADSSTYLPRTRDAGFVSLTSERETLRFQPFASYHVFRTDENPWSREARAGVSGPITENLHFYGSAGYLWEGRTDKERMVAAATLRHIIGPNTLQEFRYRRDLTYPELDLENSYTYAIRQVFGPSIYGEYFGKYATFEDLNNNNTGTEEWRTGMHFTYSPSSKTTLRVGGFYSQVDYKSGNIGWIDRWTAVGQLRQRFGKSWEGVLTYQYQTRDSAAPLFQYEENLYILTVTYFFGQHIDNSIRGDEPYDGRVIENNYAF